MTGVKCFKRLFVSGKVLANKFVITEISHAETCLSGSNNGKIRKNIVPDPDFFYAVPNRFDFGGIGLCEAGGQRGGTFAALDPSALPAG